MAAVVRKINKKKNKLVSVLLIACILFQTCIYAPTVSAEDMSFAVATGNGYITFNGINVEYDTTLQEVSSDNLTGTLSEYILTLNLKSSYSAKKLNQSTFVAENGTYSVSKSGMYLIELWGGDGASVSGAGAGGEGGHIYATAHLEAGQTIFFTLGGNGRSSNKTYDGGGANGSGGDHGIVGNYTVGGGGGYSALFLYGAGEFESTYGSLKVKNISEEDRTSKYFMIAGGGGGGGANADYGVVAGKKANGGDGGSVVSPEGYVSGTGLVEGTYFAGSNGESTGSSTSYVGRGGTNVPGATADSLLGITDAKMTPPNNWFGTVGGIGGAGGSGELRGGGGGAGYAGGSGGLMTSVILASNVSGGGGGSSFIASNVNGQNTSYYIDNTHKEYLLPDNPSQDGGAVCITYLEVGNTDFLDDMKLSWCFSEYAMPIGGTLELYENGEKVEYVRAHPEDVIPEGKIAAICDVIDENHSHEKAILSHFSLLDKNGNIGGEFTASIKFTYTEHFMGGNNLPILNNHYKSASGTSYDVFYDAPMTLFANYGGEEHEAVFDIGKDCGYVNMPLRVHVHAHNQESNAPGTAFRVDSMFYDEFALPCYDNDGNPLGSIRDNLDKLNDPSHKDSYRYSQIKDIGNYQVYNTAGEELEATDYVYPNSTTTYRVALSVQMIPSHETGMALVGRGTKTDNEGWVYFSEPAVITVPGSRSEMLGKFLVHYQKSLEYTDNAYVYTLNVKSYADEKHNVNINDTALNHVKNFGEVPNQVEFDHVIETDGWYFIELWGGNGGAGGGGILGWSEGGSGGNGGYVSGFIELQRGDVIELFYGINGQRDNGGSFVAGNGGKHSRASLIRDGVETLIMIAGGGGGGGYGFIGDGSAGKQATVYTSNPNAESEYSAHDGKNGSNRTGGEAGRNYISPLVTQVTSLDDIDNVEAIKNNGEAKNKFTSKFNQGYDTKQHGGGAGHISCLVISESAKEDVIQEVSTALTQYGIEAEISKYFDVEKITFNRASASSINVDENNVIRVTGIVPEVKSGLLSDGITATAEIDFDVVIKLSPKEGFMGGNDVPVICEPDDDLLHTNKLKLTHLQKHRVDETTDVDKTEEIYLGINDQADYANVDISYTAPVVEGVDQFYAPGNDAPIAKSALYNVKSGELPVINEGDEWKYDYVEIVNSITNLNNSQLENGETLSPIQTTAYEIAFGVRPKSPVAAKATVKDQQDGNVGTAYAVIIVGYEVLFELTELENNAEPINGRYVAEQGVDYVVKLTPVEGKVLPPNVEVRLGDTLLENGTDYTYVGNTGVITIKAATITDSITITAAAHAKKHTVNYVYAKNPNATEESHYGTAKSEFEAGQSIDSGFHSTYKPTSVEGYTFSWDWGDGSTTPPAEMPDCDLWAIGSYTANVYKLTVKYVDIDGNSVHTDSVTEITYNENYSVEIPAKSGYLAYVDGVLASNVSGTMGAADIEVTVVYKATENTLVISFLYDKDKSTASPILEKEYETGESYAVDVPQISGYTAKLDGEAVTRITGNMPSDGSSESLTVYYFPNVYTVTFVNGEDTLETREVIFDEMYGFDSIGDYSVFSEPTKPNSRFMGWYIDGTGDRIYEDSVVATARDHTLVASWEDHTYTFTVNYVYENGTTAADPKSFTGTVGSNHGIWASPEISGYTPSVGAVEVVIGSQDVVVNVVYTYKYSGNSVINATVEWGTLTFNYIVGTWNPLTHTYPTSITPSEDGKNTITVKNTGSYIDSEGEPKISIKADYGYTPNEEYESIIGVFTTNDGSKVTNADIKNGEAVTVYLNLEGTYDFPHDGTYGVGTCTVTIRGGDIEQ